MVKIKDKLIIIDGNALIHRSFHALPPTLRTKDGRLVNAVYGFASFLLKACLELHPQFIVLTLDRPGKTFRHKQYEEYKATRTKAPDELYEQIPLVKDLAKALNIPIFEKDGFEADDLIGTISKRAKEETNWHSIIITGDMDTMQLVDENTSVYTMSRGLSDSMLYGPKEVEAKYGLKPNQIVDYKALCGDSSDNIPGVSGIGQKGATELLQEFKSLDKIYQAAEKGNSKIKERTQKLLLEDKDKAYLSQDLATIDREVKLKIDWQSLRLEDFSLEKAVSFFQDMEFMSLINKLKALSGLISPEAKEKENDDYQDKFERNRTKRKYKLIDSDKDFSKFLTEIKKKKAFAIDTETTGLDPLNAKLLGLSFSWKENEAYYLKISSDNNSQKSLFNKSEDRKSWLEKLKDILENPKISKYGHNLKFDWRVLKNQGVVTRGIAFDSLLASYVLNPDNRQHGLDSVSFSELGWEKIKQSDLLGTGKKAISFDQVEAEKMTQYSGEDADCSLKLQKKLSQKLKAEKLDKLYYELELPLLQVLAEMEENGIKLESKVLDKLAKELAKRLNELTKQVHKLAGEEFNLNSPKQLQEILFDKLALNTQGLKKTKTGISTADDELAKIEYDHEIIPLIRQYRELSKLQNTYVLALPELVNKKDGRIHTSFNQSVAATGRLSSTEPNLQNIPTRSQEGKEIREAFVAQKGWTLLSLDYSQIELRLAAHLSKDKKMIDAFKKGEDIHTATAAAISGVKKDEVKPEMRYAAKATNFGILYGQGPHGLSQAAKISYGQAKDFIDKYFEVYPGIKKMMDKSIAEAKKKGYAETMFGRRRPLQDLNSNIFQVRKAAERMAVNTPIQGTAADMIKKAMLDISKYLQGKDEEIKMLLQVHDELIFEIKEDKLNTHLHHLEELMTNALKLSVPVIVGVSSGKNWGELK